MNHEDPVLALELYYNWKTEVALLRGSLVRQLGGKLDTCAQLRQMFDREQCKQEKLDIDFCLPHLSPSQPGKSSAWP